MKLENKVLVKMNEQANACAFERVKGVLDALEAKMKTSSGGMSWNRNMADSIIGTELAAVYAKGFADAAENVGIRKLIF